VPDDAEEDVQIPQLEPATELIFPIDLSDHGKTPAN
jgi:hypothetical protein